jgi:tight adherence protein C
MDGDIVTLILSPRFMGGIFTAIFVGAAILTVALPLLDRNDFKGRMNSVAVERESIRQRERERMLQMRSGTGRGGLRHEHKTFVKGVVEKFDLQKHIGADEMKSKLAMAGYRGAPAEYGFMFFRFIMPIILLLVTSLYVFVILDLSEYTLPMKIGMCLTGAYVGYKAPEVFLSNQISKRQQNMQRAFPDSLDLLLICVESGMSIEHAFRRVSVEIVAQSVPLAEEFALVTAELSYLPDRRTAFENFATRSGMDSIKAVSTALVQAEKYGTPVGAALRVLAQEGRDMRMNEAEKKASALPPKLTVPMILFFLPVLFAVIMTPALTQVFGWK